MTKILIVDDDQNQRIILQRILKKENYDCMTASSGQQALELLEKNLFDLVISDMRMGKISGRDLLKSIQKKWPKLPVLIVTAFAELQDAIRLVTHEGAFYYFEKPIDTMELKKEIKRALAEKSLQVRDSEQVIEDKDCYPSAHFGNIIGQSQSMRDLLKTMHRIVDLGANQLLITGETGTGKDLVARALHDYSPRAKKRFVAVNCHTIPNEIAETELFGHVRGAFTGADRNKPGVFETAHGGTLFLDEIGDISLNIQSKLLRILQDRQVFRVGSVEGRQIDVCVIAATNTDLVQAVEKGQFREDLYFRLNVIPLHLPPLRERRTDINLLIDHFLTKFSQEYPMVNPKTIKTSARSALENCNWPGNIRQLENCLKRTYLMSESDQITTQDLPDEVFDQTIPPVDLKIDLSRNAVSLEEIIKSYIEAALYQTGGIQTKAARLLGMSRRRLQSRMNRYGLESKNFKSQTNNLME